MHADLEAAARASADPDAVSARLRRLAAAGAKLDAAPLARTLVPVLANSRALTTFLLRHPGEIDGLTEPEALEAPLGPADLARSWRELAPTPPDDEAAMMCALRRLKSRAYLRIAARDVGLHAPIDQTCAELSELADFVTQRAVEWARRDVTARHGEATADGAPIPFVVMGMGKLGGHELNYSSDIDIIYFYGTDEGEAGALTPHAWFARVCERISRLLGQVTEDGFVFRVDLRLRPEGRGGPVCNALAGAERYYEAWGRTWERIAWLRARPIAGDLELGGAVLETLRPWIYRRTLDLSTLEEIEALKHQTLRQRRAAQAAGRQRGLDLKLDPGGIRAVEFFVNALQLLHAGREPELRDPSTLGALERLVASGHINEVDRDTLAEAYLLLRRVEHRVQMEDERQTHRLPTGPRLDALARRLGFEGEDAGALLRAEIDAHRTRVAERFDGLMADPERERPDEHHSTAAALMSIHAEPEERAEIFANLEFADPLQAVHLLDMAGRRPTSPFSARADARHRELGIELLAEVLRSTEPERALTHLAALMSIMARRPIYLDTLAQRPALSRLLVNVFATSDFLSDCLTRQPALVDTLYERGRRIREVARRGAGHFDGGPIRARLKHAVRAQDGRDDTEAFLERLARFQQREVLHIGLDDIAGELEGEAVSAALTRLAEAVLDAVLDRAAHEVAARFGWPGGEGGPLGCCVLGLGKLGGGELSYGSDLDVVFLYEDEGTLDGPRGLSHLEWYTRLAQRTISLLGLPTTAGALYDIDTRLRPGGRNGTLVTRLVRFERYHREKASPWERMALVRGRPVAGDPLLGRRVRTRVQQLAFQRPPPEGLVDEARRLRARMEAEVAREGPGRYNPKTGRGGLVDVEFIAQTLQILHGAHHPEVWTASTVEALRALGETGLLADAERVEADWRFLRRLDHRLRIVRGQSVPELRSDPLALDRLARRLGYRRDALRPDARTPGDRLLGDYRRVTGRVRARFEELLGSDGSN